MNLNSASSRAMTAAKRSGELLKSLVRDPGQARYVPGWLETLRSSTLAERLPWLPYRVMERMEVTLQEGGHVWEFGGGGSTLWFSDRASQVTTIEHDPEWYPVLSESVAHVESCEVIHHPSKGDYAEYVGSITAVDDESLAVVVVDGRERVRCFEAAMPKVQKGGLLVLDDSERARYQPCFDIAAGWPSITYAGLTPCKRKLGVTTVWQRPAAG